MFDTNLVNSLISSRNYYRDYRKIEEMRIKAIKMAHKYHYENNKFYNKFCKVKKIKDNIDEKDFYKLIYPHTVFKTYNINHIKKNPEKFIDWIRNISTLKINFSINNIYSIQQFLEQLYANEVLLGYSKGTTGKSSFVPRDRYTQIAIIKSYIESINTILNITNWKKYYIWSIAQLSFLQILWNVYQILYGIYDYKIGLPKIIVNSDKFFKYIEKEFQTIITQKIINKMKARIKNLVIQNLSTQLIKNKDKNILLILPRHLVFELANFIMHNNLDIPLSKDSRIIIYDESLYKKISTDDKQKIIKKVFENDSDIIFNTYTSTEMNSLFIESKDKKHMHIPPWVQPILFDKNNEPLESEGVISGRFGFLEPSSKSFAGFILTDDFVTIDFDAIKECDIHTPIVKNITKIQEKPYCDCNSIIGTDILKI